MIYFFFLLQNLFIFQQNIGIPLQLIIDVLADIHIVSYLYPIMFDINKMPIEIYRLYESTILQITGLLDNIRIITFLVQYILSLSQNIEFKDTFIDVQIKEIRLKMLLYHVLYECI